MVSKPERTSWEKWLNERGLSRGQTGERIQQAFEAGLDRSAVAELMQISPGYVGALAALARQRR